MKTLKNSDFVPFGNSSFSMEELTLESSEDKLSIYGEIDIFKDQEGLEKINDLLNIIYKTRNQLEQMQLCGKLPKKIELPESNLIVEKDNPFG